MKAKGHNIMADKKNTHDEDLTQENNVDQSRREFLVAAKKWSKAVVAGAIFGGILLKDDDAKAGAWANRRGGGRGAWGNGGGRAWRNGGGGGWRNGGGAAWRNGGGGAWRNGGGGAWRNGGRSWANRN